MRNYKNPIEHLVHNTVRIETVTKNGLGSGTGYFFDFLKKGDYSIPCIVTNKHVINGAIEGTFYLTLEKEDGNVDLGKHIPITYKGFEHAWIMHPEEDVDLAIFPMADIYIKLREMNVAYHYMPLHPKIIASPELLSSMGPMEEIIMIGYPNGIWDRKHNLPIIRKGITATHANLEYNGKPEFLIDAACFPGSSGSPVFLANLGSFLDKDGHLCAGPRIALLGTLHSGTLHTVTGKIKIPNIPTENAPVAVSTIPNNLGLVIQASKLMDFNAILEKFQN